MYEKLQHWMRRARMIVFWCVTFENHNDCTEFVWCYINTMTDARALLPCHPSVFLLAVMLVTHGYYCQYDSLRLSALSIIVNYCGYLNTHCDAKLHEIWSSIMHYVWYLWETNTIRVKFTTNGRYLIIHDIWKKCSNYKAQISFYSGRSPNRV